jgi:hypothetical protein
VNAALALPEQARLSRDEARSLTDEVKRDAERLWRKLVELYEGGAHLALGYPSWAAYFKAEFGGEKSQAYRILNAGRVAAALDSPNGERLNEAQARELAPLLDSPDELRDAWNALRDEFGEQITAADVRQLVKGTLRNRQFVAYMCSSESFEWYTPPGYIAAVRKVLGAIDLDPASCEQANATVGAGRFYTEAENGLLLPWFGRVFCNPPYGPAAPHFVDKLIGEYQAGNVTAAILLVNAYSTERPWLQGLLRTRPVCFTDHRIKFTSPIARGGSSTHGSAFVYFGDEPARFVEVFGAFGVVVGWGCVACAGLAVAT